MNDYKTDAIFLSLMKNVFAVEGGYLSPEKARALKDSGGATKFGISYYNNISILDTMGIHKPSDMINLTREQAMQVAYIKYWLPSGGSSIPDYDLAEIHYDAAFNCGVNQASKWLRSLSRNPANYEGGGHNKQIFFPLILEYLAMRMRFYAGAKGRETFLAGWINRLATVSQNMAKDDPQ